MDQNHYFHRRYFCHRSILRAQYCRFNLETFKRLRTTCLLHGSLPISSETILLVFVAMHEYQFWFPFKYLKIRRPLSPEVHVRQLLLAVEYMDTIARGWATTISGVMKSFKAIASSVEFNSSCMTSKPNLMNLNP